MKGRKEGGMQDLVVGNKKEEERKSERDAEDRSEVTLAKYIITSIPEIFSR